MSYWRKKYIRALIVNNWRIVCLVKDWRILCGIGIIRILDNVNTLFWYRTVSCLKIKEMFYIINKIRNSLICSTSLNILNILNHIAVKQNTQFNLWFNSLLINLCQLLGFKSIGIIVISHVSCPYFSLSLIINEKESIKSFISYLLFANIWSGIGGGGK